MGTPYPLEKKNQILGRILSKEITVEQAHREYSIATSCVYRWLRQLKADSRSGGQGTQAIPLPQGMNFRAALVAEGYCQEVGFESPAGGGSHGRLVSEKDSTLFFCTCRPYPRPIVGAKPLKNIVAWLQINKII